MYQKSWYNLTHAQSVCTRLSFPSRPAPSGEPGFEASPFTAMALFRRPGVAQAFRNNRQLQQFVLTGVTPTGRVLGTGSYGSVEEVSVELLGP